MYIVKVLKRRDAASVIVAIILGFLLLTPLQLIPQHWANKLVGDIDNPTRYSYPLQDDWKQVYVLPLLALVLQVVLVEIGLRVAIFLRAGLVRRK